MEQAATRRFEIQAITLADLSLERLARLEFLQQDREGLLFSISLNRSPIGRCIAKAYLKFTTTGSSSTCIVAESVEVQLLGRTFNTVDCEAYLVLSQNPNVNSVLGEWKIKPGSSITKLIGSRIALYFASKVMRIALESCRRRSKNRILLLD